MIIPESERSAAPLAGEKVFFHPDMVRENECIQRFFCWPLKIPTR